MKPIEIKYIALAYQEQLIEHKIPAERMNPINKTFRDMDSDELLMHAHYLCQNIFRFLPDDRKWDKVNRHFAAMQMCLSFAGWYTLDQLRDHNKTGVVKSPSL